MRLLVHGGPLRVAEREHRHRVLPYRRRRPVAHRVRAAAAAAAVAAVVEVAEYGVLVRRQLQVHVLEEIRLEMQDIKNVTFA